MTKWEQDKCMCKECGSVAWWVFVSQVFIETMCRPEAQGFDMWCYCSSKQCSHAYGEGVFDQDEHTVTWLEAIK